MHATPVRHAVGVSTDPVSVYYERISPAAAPPRATVVMIHGGGHTGLCWQRTADGRPGWAYRFAEAGHAAIVPDWPGHGRSGALDPDSITGELVCQGLAGMIRELGGPVVLVTHSMGGALGWRVAEIAGPQIIAIAGIAPGPPGNIQPRGEIVSETAEEFLIRTPQRTARMKRGGVTFNDEEFVVRKLVGSSRRFPRARIGAYAKSLSTTASRLLYERQNTLGSQVRVQNQACFAGKPILVLTGDEDLDHPRDIDGAVAEWLAANGARTEFVWLADRGITGNGHMLMMEDNSDDIADMVIAWIDTAIR